MLPFWKDKSGSAASEYILIMAIIGAGLSIALATFGDQLSIALSYAGSTMLADL